MPAPTSEFDKQLRQLDTEIKKLEVEYNQFFAGRLPKLPWETRARVEALVKQYDRMHIKNTAERFRFQGLQARFSAFCELWERHLKAQEGGRPGLRGRVASPPVVPVVPVAPAAPPAAVPRHNVVTLRDPAADADKVRVLHGLLNATRRTTGEVEVPFERFAEVVRAQVAKVAKEGGEVAFRVGVKDGRVTFTAKAAVERDGDG